MPGIGILARICKLLVLWTLCLLLSPLTPAQAAGPNRATPLPEVVFQGLDGSPVPLSDFKGQVVLINFWGTWCEPCLKEIPELVHLSHQYKENGLQVLGIAVDSGRPEDIRLFMAEHQMDYRVLIGEMETVKRQFRVLGFPTSLLVDRNGMIQRRYFGPQTLEAFQKSVEPLL